MGAAVYDYLHLGMYLVVGGRPQTISRVTGPPSENHCFHKKHNKAEFSSSWSLILQQVQKLYGFPFSANTSWEQ
jgi:hypothetical protein